MPVNCRKNANNWKNCPALADTQPQRLLRWHLEKMKQPWTAISAGYLPGYLMLPFLPVHQKENRNSGYLPNRICRREKPAILTRLLWTWHLQSACLKIHYAIAARFR